MLTHKELKARALKRAGVKTEYDRLGQHTTQPTRDKTHGCEQEIKIEEFVKAIEKSRTLIKSGRYTACPCPQVRCEWHGMCFECVLIHRTKKHHLPGCLQPIIRRKIRALAKTCEMGTTDERPKKKHWDHLYRVSPPKKY